MLTKEVVVGHDYHGEPEIVQQTSTVELAEQELILDQSFDEREIVFDCDKDVIDSETAKQFCFYLSSQDERDWTEADILRLIQIVKCFPSSIKHAAWLMVAALNYSEEDAFDTACQFVTKELLQSEEIHEFGKSRVLHHLLKQRDRFNPYLSDIVGLASDSTFRKAIVQQAQSAQSTLLRIYAKETLFQLINENEECTKKQFISAYVAKGIRLNQAELRAMGVFEPVEVFRIPPEGFEL
ncbi:hypothetical protein [Vibrio agarivorans]|uniref:hypothetical protein n=1 Tax=Vibrio agarivorans TaxID=153622 RepID=UPI0025B35EE5|nr:hypothetical protein [Vibrio agarivorans]MDN3663366.1 hypothetical protein [Vibrio agarivorans]